jgi:hypothetical protein
VAVEARPDVAGGDRVAEIRLGQPYLTLALRTDADGEGDVGFDVTVPCPHDDCTGRTWVPAHSVKGACDPAIWCVASSREATGVGAGCRWHRLG